MKRRSSSLLMSLLIICLCLATVGATVAFLTAVSNSVTNTFTIGNITISLTETTGNTYPIVPGTEIGKDPRVTVKTGSDSCWLYVKLDASDTFSSYLSYTVASGWQKLEGYDNVYFRRVEKATTDTVFAILENDLVTVKDTVTEEMMSHISQNPTLTFSAYAIQQISVETAEAGWETLMAST